MEQEKCFGERTTNWQSSSTSSSSSPSKGSSGSDRRGDFSYYAYLEEHINNKAKKLTVEYLKGRIPGNSQQQQLLQEQVFLVYKFIHTPLDAIIAGM